MSFLKGPSFLKNLPIKLCGEIDQEITNSKILKLSAGALQFPVSNGVSIKIRNVANPITLPPELFGPEVMKTPENIRTYVDQWRMLKFVLHN